MPNLRPCVPILMILLTASCSSEPTPEQQLYSGISGEWAPALKSAVPISVSGIGEWSLTLTDDQRVVFVADKIHEESKVSTINVDSKTILTDSGAKVQLNDDGSLSFWLEPSDPDKEAMYFLRPQESGDH